MINPPNVTYQDLVNLLLESMKTSDNVDLHYESLDYRFKPGWSTCGAMPVLWDFVYDKCDSSVIRNVNNHVTIKSSTIISQVTHKTIEKQLNSFLNILGATTFLNSQINSDKFLWFLNNLCAYYKHRVRWITSLWAQDIVPTVYLDTPSVNTPFYPTTNKVDKSYFIKDLSVPDLVDIFSPTHLGLYVYTIPYSYEFSHN